MRWLIAAVEYTAVREALHRGDCLDFPTNGGRVGRVK
jgi:hypothetical protein